MTPDAPPAASGFFESWTRKWQYVLDKSSPHVTGRWIGFLVLFIVYFLRVYYLNGWFIVTYGLGIYLLNQLIGFLSPQVCFLVYHHALLFICCNSLIPRRTMWMLACLREIQKSSGELFVLVLSSCFEPVLSVDLLHADYPSSSFGTPAPELWLSLSS